MTEPFHVRPENRGYIAVTGDDARSFLQGIVTNDVDALSPNQAQYGAMLTPQGRVMWDFLIAEIDGTIVLECALDRLPAFQKRLSLYRLRAAVELADRSEDFVAIAFPGAGARVALGLSETPGAAKPWHGGVLFTDPRLAELGARAIAPADKAAAALAESGIADGSADDYDRMRLALGVPEGAVDLPPEKALPLEVGLDELNAISWTKGCYMGQELTARMNYRALVKKRLLPVTIEGAAPEPGSSIELDGKEAGEMRSSNGGRGLAYLRLEAVDRAAELGQPLTCGEARLSPKRPDWLKLPSAGDS